MSNIIVTETAIERVQTVRKDKNNPALNLRITVEGGGCSGFQYIFSWDSQVAVDDLVFENAVVTDQTSLPFLENATLDYIVNMMGEDFKITNPNAKSGCGCGTSFAI